MTDEPTTTENAEGGPATPEQLDELSALAGGEDIPKGMLAHEAAQRIVELKTASH